MERFPFEFHRRWFEMYLAVALRRHRLAVSAPKPGPDLRAELEGLVVWIEAIAPGPGDPLHADAVAERVSRPIEAEPVATRVPVDQITLRIAQAFRAKREKFGRYLRDGRIGRNDACIIAINVRGIPYAWPDLRDQLQRAVYGVGDHYVGIAGNPPRIVESGRHARDLLPRASGAMEDVASLVRYETNEISAVLGSWADVANYPARLGDDFVLAPHVNPLVALPGGAIELGIEWILTPSVDGWNVETIRHLVRP